MLVIFHVVWKELVLLLVPLGRRRDTFWNWLLNLSNFLDDNLLFDLLNFFWLLSLNRFKWWVICNWELHSTLFGDFHISLAKGLLIDVTHDLFFTLLVLWSTVSYDKLLDMIIGSHLEWGLSKFIFDGSESVVLYQNGNDSWLSSFSSMMQRCSSIIINSINISSMTDQL